MTMTVIIASFFLYCGVVLLFLRFFTFMHECDIQVRTMVGSKDNALYQRMEMKKKKRAKKVREPRFIPA